MYSPFTVSALKLNTILWLKIRTSNASRRWLRQPRFEVRTDPSQRDGYYIAIKLEASDQPEKADKLRLYFVRPGSQEVETKTLTIGPIKKYRALIGMTDDVWGSTSSIPTAWKIEFLDSTGAVISTSQSFLWSNRS